jgi:hypothetical protein
MTDSFMQNHQTSLDLQREEDEINWLGFGPDTEDTEDEDNFPMESNPDLERIRLPNHWGSYLANGVEDSLEDGEKETIHDVLDTANLSDHTCVDVLDDSNFELAPSWYPSLLAGDYCTYVFDKF